MIVNSYLTQLDSNTRHALITFAHWLGPRLLGKRLSNNISIDIRAKPLAKGDHGYAQYKGNNNIRPREFEIDLNETNDLKLLLVTLAHEMVHVKQDARGERQHRLRGNKMYWHGVDHTDQFHDDFGAPWELEAYALEEELTKEFLFECIGELMV